MADYFYLRFYHKGQFVKDKYLCGKCTKIPTVVDVDTFSFSVLMEYVKDDVGYSEIGGIYVKKQGGGWKIVQSDVDVGEILDGKLEGCHLDFYIDTVVDKAIEPIKQMQPHVIIRPRTLISEGQEKVKRQYVTIHDLRMDHKCKKKGADGALESVVTEKPDSAPQIEGKEKCKIKKAKKASTMDQLPDFEERRKKRMAENNRMLEELRIKKLKAELEVKSKNKKVVVDGNISDLEFDRDYVSGHDSLTSSDDELPAKRSKKVAAEKVATRRPTTRSKTVKNVAESTQTKYIIPEDGKDWVLKSICDAWRMHKSRFKAEYYTKYDTDEKRLQNRPKSVPLENFKILLQYWGLEKVQSDAKKNSNNRRRITDTHTAGRTAFAQIGNKLKKTLETPDTPSKGQIYPKTRKGHEDNQETKVGEDGQIIEEVPKITEVNFDAHGPNWLVGRSGRTRRTRKNPAQLQSQKSAEITKLREEIAAEMEEKMNQKLKLILGKLAEKNPSLEINVEELCATAQSEQQFEGDGDGDASVHDQGLDD